MKVFASGMPPTDWFGVRIHQPVQILGIGTGPYFLVSWWDGKENIPWHKHCEPDQPFTFIFPKFRAEVRGVATHTTLSLMVTIRSA